MAGERRTTTVGQLPTPESQPSRVPVALTRLVWLLWVASLGVLAVWFHRGEGWAPAGMVVVDGLTVVMWTTVTFFSGVVHSYSRRYMAGDRAVDRFFGRVFAFTLAVMLLVAADGLVVFGAAWLAMGLVMSGLIGHGGDRAARAAAALARRYVPRELGAARPRPRGAVVAHRSDDRLRRRRTVVTASPPVLFAAGALLLAAMVQSALVPFHAWLLSSMTAPTPASALMHAGFVNAGGVLLVRFAPVVTVDSRFMLAVVLVGATSAILGKLLKTVRADVKGGLGCSTVGQMGFMIAQAGLGFFAAAVTHLVLHGFYKAYQFLGSGGRVTREHPTASAPTRSTTAAGVAVTVGTALAGGALFTALTGKGTGLNGGLLLTLLVVLTTLHAARDVVTRTALPKAARYGAVPAVALPALAVYGGVYGVVERLLAGLPAVGEPEALTAVHGVVAVAFVLAYLVVESGVYRRSPRLYVWLLNATSPPAETRLEGHDDS
ncbi:MAG: NADH:ubiquinone oxidoreductase subunit 5 (chain L)/multisubunit Na+/H+ antiporter, MnhA subunit [uncultured archaeon A07HB70]|nr:MAG: NADH:ubiquinone oxidoreductase subunit 5 (chain L)/multisubunit Na+/H+ antiporter, MnhA subunit [uncultured archaeon A07HB70]